MYVRIKIFYHSKTEDKSSLFNRKTNPLKRLQLKWGNHFKLFFTLHTNEESDAIWGRGDMDRAVRV